MTIRDELVMALSGRYVAGSRVERGRMLDEFAALTGHHRKHAMRLLRAGLERGGSGLRSERRMYDQATRAALIVIWEALDRVCGKRLRPLVPILVAAMERYGHLQLAPEVRTGLLAMSAATIDRALGKARGEREGGHAAVRHPRPRSGAASWCGPSMTGTTRRRGSWGRTWWHIAAQRPRAATCKR